MRAWTWGIVALLAAPSASCKTSQDSKVANSGGGYCYNHLAPDGSILVRECFHAGNLERVCKGGPAPCGSIEEACEADRAAMRAAGTAEPTPCKYAPALACFLVAKGDDHTAYVSCKPDIETCTKFRAEVYEKHDTQPCTSDAAVIAGWHKLAQK